MSDYEIPAVKGMLIKPDHSRCSGTLRELLMMFGELNPKDQRRSSILLDHAIAIPPDFPDLSGNGKRMNIFDGEAAALLRYL